MTTDYDLDALADQMMAAVSGTPATGDEPEPASVEGVEEPAATEASNEVPITESSQPAPETDLEAYYQSRLTQDVSAYQQNQQARELEERISKALQDDEEAAKLGRDLAQQYFTEQQRQSVATESVSQYTQTLFDSIFTPEFVNSLTAEERERLDADKFDSDQAYLAAVMDVQADRKAAEKLSAVREEAAKEARLAVQNEQRGKALSASSATAIPPARYGDSIQGKSGRDLMAEAFDDIRREAAGLNTP